MLTGDKRLARSGRHELADGAPFHGYEMHMGRTDGPDTRAAAAALADGRPDGAVLGRTAASPGPMCMACLQRRPRSARPGWRGSAPRRPGSGHEAEIEAALDALAAHLEAHIDVDRLLSLAR